MYLIIYQKGFLDVAILGKAIQAFDSIRIILLLGFGSFRIEGADFNRFVAVGLNILN